MKRKKPPKFSPSQAPEYLAGVDPGMDQGLGVDGPELWAENAEPDCNRCLGTGAVSRGGKLAPCPCTAIDPESVEGWDTAGGLIDE